MARLFGIEIPNEKRVEASLCYIYGIGPSTAKKVLEHEYRYLTLNLFTKSALKN